jgi:hypothetical protein
MSIRSPAEEEFDCEEHQEHGMLYTDNQTEVRHSSEIDDLAEELGCSVPAATRKAIEYGIRYHKNDIINEVMEDNNNDF